MTRLTAKAIEAFEATRDIEAEILLGIDDMLANNAAKRTVINQLILSRTFLFRIETEFRIRDFMLNNINFKEEICMKLVLNNE